MKDSTNILDDNEKVKFQRNVQKRTTEKYIS